MTAADKIAEARTLTAELREHGNDLHGSPVGKSNSCLKAADAVSALADIAEAQAQQITQLRAALKPFADAADGRRRTDPWGVVCFSQNRLITARAALGDA